jgi:DNA topoisomerase-1
MSKYDLLIVESPSKAKAIQKYLQGMNIKVIASKGHIMELPKKELGVDLKTFKTHDIVMQGKEREVDEIKSLAKNADKIYLGSDFDTEGARIAHDINELVKSYKKPTYRVVFLEVTKKAIEKALAAPGALDKNQVNAQRTRRILDRLIGYKISPLLWAKLGSGLSAGRVQSVALRLIVEREDEIINFIPEHFFWITAILEKDQIKFDTKYFGEAIDKKLELKDPLLANQILQDIQSTNFVVESVEKKEKKLAPSPPFTTSKLQQESSNKLKLSAKETMQIAQKLYDGSISLGDKGNQGLITYMRTDSVRTEPDAIIKVREFIGNKYGANYVPKDPNTFKVKNQAAAQEAHEAIRPTNLDFDPELIRPYLSNDEYRLYKLIWNKFIASQMPVGIDDQTIVMFNANKHFFKSVGTVLNFDGYRRIYQDEDDKKKDDDESGALPGLVIANSLTPVDPPKLIPKQTTPPARFTEATLVKILEEKGIGRPSTYAAIIDNIMNRQYVEKKDSKFSPTPVGTSLARFLILHFSKQVDIGFTAQMETLLDDIEEGKKDYIEILKEFWSNLESILIQKDKEIESIPQPVREKKIDPSAYSHIKCLKCGSGEYIVIKGSKGEFLSCSDYPQCKSTQQFKRNKKGEIKIEDKNTYHETPCAKCGSKMALREGKFGKFWSCSNYPTCKHIMPFTLDVTCPQCNVGKFVKKMNKDGKDFYGCSNYPNCKNIMNLKPIAKACSKCQFPVMGEKKEKGKDTLLFCGKCKNFDPVEKKPAKAS